MKKQAVLRGILGVPIGIAVGQVITVLISLISADGAYWPCAPAFVDQVGNVAGAVALQTVLCALLGAVCGAASVIWQIDRWSIARQSATYFLVMALCNLPIAYLAHWMEHSASGVLSYFGIFFGIFVAVWAAQYAALRYKIKKISDRLKQQDSSPS